MFRIINCKPRKLSYWVKRVLHTLVYIMIKTLFTLISFSVNLVNKLDFHVEKRNLWSSLLFLWQFRAHNRKKSHSRILIHTVERARDQSGRKRSLNNLGVFTEYLFNFTGQFMNNCTVKFGKQLDFCFSLRRGIWRFISPRTPWRWGPLVRWDFSMLFDVKKGLQKVFVHHSEDAEVPKKRLPAVRYCFHTSFLRCQHPLNTAPKNSSTARMYMWLWNRA